MSITTSATAPVNFAPFPTPKTLYIEAPTYIGTSFTKEYEYYNTGYPPNL